MSVRLPHNLRLRRNFGKIHRVVDIPNLIEIQRLSYAEFLQHGAAPDGRKDTGLQGVFRSVFPIKDFNETASLEFVSYDFGEPEVHDPRMPRARDDLRRSAQGDDPVGDLGRR